jgi:hypothetical protein
MIRISGKLVNIKKGDRLVGKRSSKEFEVLGYQKTPWTHEIFILQSSDGEIRKVASFLLGKKYNLVERDLT